MKDVATLEMFVRLSRKEGERERSTLQGQGRHGDKVRKGGDVLDSFTRHSNGCIMSSDTLNGRWPVRDSESRVFAFTRSAFATPLSAKSAFIN